MDFGNACGEALRLLQRRAWDAEHLATLGTKVSIAEARKFKELCRAHRTTPYAVLQAYVKRVIGSL